MFYCKMKYNDLKRKIEKETLDELIEEYIRKSVVKNTFEIIAFVFEEGIENNLNWTEYVGRTIWTEKELLFVPVFGDIKKYSMNGTLINGE